MDLIIFQQQRVIFIINGIDSLGVRFFNKITQIFQPALTKGKTADFFLSNNNDHYYMGGPILLNKRWAAYFI